MACTPHPGIWEHHRIAQPLRARLVQRSPLRFELQNRSDFVDSDRFRWLIALVDGVLIDERRITIPAIAPGATRVVSAAFRQPTLQRGEELVLRLVYELKRATDWAPRGHQVGFDEWIVARRAPARRVRNAAVVDAQRRGPTVDVTAGELALQFNADDGRLTGLSFGGRKLLAKGPALALWRAPTDNDGVKHADERRRVAKMVGVASGGTDRPGLECCVGHHGAAHSNCSERCITWSRGRCDIRQRERWVVSGNGDVLLTQDIVIPRPRRPAAAWPASALAPGTRNAELLRRGPEENYVDRQFGYPLGRYDSTVDAEYVPYVVPQEHGNHTDVRWFALHDGETGLLFQPHEPAQFSVSHFTDEDMFKARHTVDLTRRDTIDVHLDFKNRGVGTGACGPDTLPRYRIGGGRYRFEWLLRFRCAESNPAHWRANAIQLLEHDALPDTSSKYPLRMAAARSAILAPDRCRCDGVFRKCGFFVERKAFSRAEVADVIAAIDPLEAQTEAFLRTRTGHVWYRTRRQKSRSARIS